MSRTMHIVVQFSLLVIWALILISDSTITASSQTCTQPPYFWMNPVRNYWNPNVGNITVKLDSLFATHSPEVPDAAARLEAGTRQWNNLDICAPSINFSDFGSETFTQSEYQSNPPPSHVYFFVAPVEGSFAEEQSVNSGNFCIAAIIRIRPNSPVVAANASEFNFTASHEIGHSFNLGNCSAQCASVSVMGGVPRDGPGSCDIEKVRALYCPTPSPSPSPSPTPTPNSQAECQLAGLYWNFTNNTCGTAPAIGMCGGGADWGTYFTTGCYSGLSLISGTCGRSTTFQSKCYQYGGDYDSQFCVCIGCDTCGGSPILIDVNGDGFLMTDVGHGVRFDLNGNGTRDQLSWTEAGTDDAWLALDRNGNGTIDNGQELFGDLTPQPDVPMKNGFLALAEFDKTANGGNSDRVIDNNDPVFGNLRLWQDFNHNGISESSELHKFSDFGLKILFLDFKLSKKTDEYGNEFKYRAKVKDTKDAQLGRWAWDVFLLGSGD
jgi:hypothetical protein